MPKLSIHKIAAADSANVSNVINTPSFATCFDRRSLERASSAIKTITDEHPSVASNIEVLEIDVSDDASVSAAASAFKAKGKTLHALVNNAGVGLGSAGDILATNFYGPKRVTDAFVDFVDKDSGRIVNVSSGSASMWLRNQDDATKALFTSETSTWEELEACMLSNESSYGLSKAGLTGEKARLLDNNVHR